MKHVALLMNSPALWLGAMTFRSNRMDIYESLLSKLDGTGRASVQTVGQIFAEWAAREHARHETLGYVYDYVRRKHMSLAEGLRPFIDNDEYLILSGGERRGDLVGAVQSLLDNMRAKQEMNGLVAAAFAVPVAGLLSLLILSAVFGVMMWPDFMRNIPEKFWPAWTRPCIDTQLFLGKYWWSLFLLGGIVAAYQSSVDRWTGRSRAFFDHLPPWSIYKGRIAANTLTIMSALVGSGMAVRQALVMIEEGAAPYLRWHMRRIIRRYDASGDNSMTALRDGLFSRRMLDRIEDASAGRAFDQTLREVGARSMSLVVRALRTQAAAASAGMLLVVGLLFGYTTMVMVFGVQEATDAYTSSITKAAGGGL